MIVGRTESWSGRLLLIVLIVITVIPFVSLLTTALHPSNTVPPGLEWPSDPQWGNFLEAFDQANMGALLTSSVLIVLGVVPAAVLWVNADPVRSMVSDAPTAPVRISLPALAPVPALAVTATLPEVKAVFNCVTACAKVLPAVTE